MARLKYILAIINLAFFIAAKTQTDSVIHLKQVDFIEGGYTNFYADNLNNVYLINANNQIKKINDKGDSVAVSNALKKYGDIYSMDISNALKIIVYYRDFSTIAVLDRFLKSVNTIDLRKYGILQAGAVAVSYDNNYWVFDEVENKLKKIDDNGNLLLSTPDMRTVFDEPFSPEEIIDYDGSVYLYNKVQGFKIFDYYGALKQNLPLTNWNNIQVVKNSVTGFADGAMHVYNTALFTEKLYSFEQENNNAIKQQKVLDNFYVLKMDGLHIYNFTYKLN